MVTLEQLIPLVDRRRMALRAWAFAHLDLAATHQVRDASGTADRHLASVIRIAATHGLTEAEIRTVIRQARKEAA